MTRRRDLLRVLGGYLLCMISFIVIVQFITTTTFSKIDFKTILISFGIQTILLVIGSYYVWRANIVKTKEIPDYLNDTPESIIYFLGLPTFFIFYKTIVHIDITSSLSNLVTLITSLTLLIISIILITPVLIEGVGLILSSKYSKFKNK